MKIKYYRTIKTKLLKFLCSMSILFPVKNWYHGSCLLQRIHGYANLCVILQDVEYHPKTWAPPELEHEEEQENGPSAPWEIITYHARSYCIHDSSEKGLTNEFILFFSYFSVCAIHVLLQTQSNVYLWLWQWHNPPTILAFVLRCLLFWGQRSRDAEKCFPGAYKSQSVCILEGHVLRNRTETLQPGSKGKPGYVHT